MSLAGVCPETVTIQTDWMPEAEHGCLYQMVGEGYEIDAGKAYVTGPLIDSAGNDTGVDIQIRSGGAPQNFSPADADHVPGRRHPPRLRVHRRGDPVLGRLPDRRHRVRLREEPADDHVGPGDLSRRQGHRGPRPRRRRSGQDRLARQDPLLRRGRLHGLPDRLGDPARNQVDGSYTGDPSLFVADEGEAAQQGFGSAEPYLYENEIEDWGKPVKYQYINDLGWRNYAESIATKPENIETYRDCFESLVPVIQQATVDYLNDPARPNAIMLDAVAEFGEDFGWTYTEGTINYGVETMSNDGLVANGPDGVMGKFDLDRVAELIELAVPIYEAQGAPPKEGVTPEDIVTNEFIDESIGL